MTRDILQSLPLEELGAIVSSRDYEHSSLLPLLDRHTRGHARIRHRAIGRQAMEYLFELYEQAVAATDQDESAWLMPHHFRFFFVRIREFALSYGGSYTGAESSVAVSGSWTDDPRQDFRRNFELFCASEPSPEAHRLLLAACASVCRHFEWWTWTRSLKTDLSLKDVRKREGDVEPFTISENDYTKTMEYRNQLEASLSKFEETTETMRRYLIKLYLFAAEACVPQADDCAAPFVRTIIGQFCTLLPEMQDSCHFVLILGDGEETEADAQCKSFLLPFFYTTGEPDPREYSAEELLRQFPRAARGALRAYCSLLRQDQCLMLWPALIWLFRIIRLEIEWAYAELLVCPPLEG